MKRLLVASISDKNIKSNLYTEKNMDQFGLLKKFKTILEFLGTRIRDHQRRKFYEIKLLNMEPKPDKKCEQRVISFFYLK